MEWQQLEYFQTVARMEHMTRAAQFLSVSQSALSRSISRMEEELGVPLFDRVGRSIKLNRYGELFLKRVHRIMKEHEEGKLEIQNMLDEEAGEVMLGFLHTLGSQLIPDLIVTFRANSPNIRFQLNQSNTVFLLQQLIQGSIDLCLLSSLDEVNLSVEWKQLWSEELFVFVPAHHPLANRESIVLAEIADEPMISFKKGYGLRNVIDRLCMEAGFTPKIAFEGEEVPTVAGLVAAGLGVALIPDVSGLTAQKLVKLKVSSPECYRIIGVAWMKDRYLSPPTVRFLQFVMNYFENTD
ncbi:MULTISPECIES: LysR family transcriptional regulator [unclassified Paenibacillus]|uniref:LysR family transcriptional regulator n=1 Tax=unclassified Paenibacillus TaxID=185978 RepID=UPI001AE8800E|nr:MULTISPECIES: LysR family transcriptional regulator [unclassified Paenibacillus]MBP1157216.1 DNA-binding transcriptional LysR family regulator [Paenibacillus sp. PvP091]MBP1172045.1 DNA-binding transcriptional LysR family regulator [Paenibacillus sp. PvR098]MBP2438426.1 DNA-binding transcriptional LysR family regulator [Paenibacillus sp. PvP052]